MSVQAMSWALDQDLPVAGQKLTLIVLANYADKAGWCFPGQSTLAKDTSQCERTIRNHLTALEEAGFLRKARRTQQNGRRTSDEFQLSLPAMDSAGQPATVSNSTGNGFPLTKKVNLPEEEKKDSTSSGCLSKAETQESTVFVECSSKSKIIESMVSVYHDACPSLPKAIKITPAREKRLMARLKSDLGDSLDAWRVYCENIEASDYLTGKVKDWRADLDWIINLGNFVKIMEGRYVNRKNRNQGGQASQYESIRRSIEGEDDPSG